MSSETTSQTVTAAEAKAFMADAGLVIDELTASRVTGHAELGPEHHTPWGIVNGGVYCTFIEGTASLGASAAVQDRAGNDEMSTRAARRSAFYYRTRTMVTCNGPVSRT